MRQIRPAAVRSRQSASIRVIRISGPASHCRLGSTLQPQPLPVKLSLSGQPVRGPVCMFNEADTCWRFAILDRVLKEEP